MAKLSEAPKLHHMVRTISFTGSPGPNGEQPIGQVDAEVSAWLKDGYELFATHYAGETPGGIRVLYVLIHQNGAA